MWLQVVALSQLVELLLSDCDCRLQSNMHAIAAPMTSLKLTDCWQYSGLLSLLPDLEQLSIWDPEGYEDADTISGTLSALQQLTSLILTWSFPTVPDSLPHLINLRHLSVHCRGQADAEVEGLPPQGSWCHGLQELGIDVGMAFSSLETLRGMPALTHLHLYCSPSDFSNAEDYMWESLLEAAVEITLLQHFDIESDCDEDLVMGFDLAGSLLALQRRRPYLVITPLCTDFPGDWGLE